MAIIDNPLSDGIQAVSQFAQSLINRVWPDPAQQAQAQLQLQTLIQSGELARMTNDANLALAQIGVNKTEAESAGLFKSGWRPFIGWVCGSSFAWNFVAAPSLTWAINLLNAFGVIPHQITFAPADMSQMMPVLLGMLGFGTMRMFERIQGKS